MHRPFFQRIMFLMLLLGLLLLPSKAKANESTAKSVIDEVKPLLVKKNFERAYARMKAMTTNDSSDQKDGLLLVLKATICDLAGHKKEADSYYEELSHRRHNFECGKNFTSDADAFLYWSTPFLLGANRGPELVSIAVALQTHALEALDKEEGNSPSLRRAKITHALGLSYQFEGDYANATKYLARACGLFYSLPDKDRITIRENIDTAEQLAQTRNAAGRPQEAERIYVWALAVSIDNQTPFVDLLGNYLALLVNCKAPQQKYAAVEDLLIHALAKKKEFGGRQMDRLRVASLGSDLRVKGKPLEEKVDEVREHVLSRLQRPQ